MALCPPPLRYTPRRQLELLQVKLDHRNGTTVTLQGMLHFARQSFYDAVNMMVERTPGRILPEGVSGDMSPEGKALRQHVDRFCEQVMKILDGLHLQVVDQQHALHLPRERTLSVDTSYDAFANEGCRALPRRTTLPKEIVLPPDDSPAWHLYRGLCDAFLVRLPLIAQLLVPLSPAFSRTILEQRNARVRRGIQSVTDRREDVIVPWGALHLPGIADPLLRSNQWSLRKESIHYIPAYKRQTTVLQSLLDAWKTHGSPSKGKATM